MRNIKLTITYDGTHYLGWQKTHMGSSIEETLTTAIEKILQHKVALQAASRTDAGVHAKGQVVNFFTAKDLPCLGRLKIGLNSVLPLDIRVLTVDEVTDHFHPTLDCKSKEYHYYICCDAVQFPCHRLYSWHVHKIINIENMKKAAKLLSGTHDYSSFCNFKKNSRYSDYVRTVESIHITELPEKRLRFEIKGNNFLYKMVRNLVGTIVYVGIGKLSIDQISDILESRQRPQAGVTAPAHGLFLNHVFF